MQARERPQEPAGWLSTLPEPSSPAGAEPRGQPGVRAQCLLGFSLRGHTAVSTKCSQEDFRNLWKLLRHLLPQPFLRGFLVSLPFAQTVTHHLRKRKIKCPPWGRLDKHPWGASLALGDFPGRGAKNSLLIWSSRQPPQTGQKK